MNILNVGILQIVDILIINVGLIIKLLKNSPLLLLDIITKTEISVTN